MHSQASKLKIAFLLQHMYRERNRVRMHEDFFLFLR